MTYLTFVFQTPPWNPFLPFPMFPGVFQQQALPLSTAAVTTTATHECRFCGKSFEALEVHMEAAHAAEGLRCRECKGLFFSRRKLDSHSCPHHSTNSATKNGN